MSIQSWWAEFGGGACLSVGLVVVVSGCDCGCCCLDDLLRLLTTLYTQREHRYVCACACVRVCVCAHWVLVMVGFCRDMCRALGSGALIILATSPQDPGKSTCTTTLNIIDSQTYFELIVHISSGYCTVHYEMFLPILFLHLLPYPSLSFH